MKQRRLIKSQIIDAWKHSIDIDYQPRRITSEPALQASLWRHLNNQLQENRRVFTEPTLSVDGRKIIPDLVVCNSRSVIAVIELKYLPRGRPRYAKDIQNLALLAEHREKVVMSDARFRGVGHRVKAYPFARHILFVWAGVHARAKALPTNLYSDGHPLLDGCFMELHAETAKEGPPTVFYRD